MEGKEQNTQNVKSRFCFVEVISRNVFYLKNILLLLQVNSSIVAVLTSCLP